MVDRWQVACPTMAMHSGAHAISSGRLGSSWPRQIHILFFLAKCSRSLDSAGLALYLPAVARSRVKIQHATVLRKSNATNASSAKTDREQCGPRLEAVQRSLVSVVLARGESVPLASMRQSEMDSRSREGSTNRRSKFATLAQMCCGLFLSVSSTCASSSKIVRAN